MGLSKEVWIGCDNVMGENNGMKGEAPQMNGSVDVVPTIGGGVDSPKPSLRETVATSNILVEKAMDTKAGA